MSKSEKQNIKLDKVDDKTAYENLLIKYEELENKIADIKANCDLAIEGRDVKIMELEQKLEQTEKDLADYQFNYPTIKELEQENAELKERVEKAEDLIEDMYDRIPASHSDYYKDVMERARQFIKEIEK